METETGVSLPEAVAELAATKAEHRKILHQVAGDPGMKPETRLKLIEHLCQEEDEHVRKIAALAGGAATPAPSQESGQHPTGLTVGSLRREPAPGVRLGSLRIGR